jgi:hypothetical protein
MTKTNETPQLKTLSLSTAVSGTSTLFFALIRRDWKTVAQSFVSLFFNIPIAAVDELWYLVEPEIRRLLSIPKTEMPNSAKREAVLTMVKTLIPGDQWDKIGAGVVGVIIDLCYRLLVGRA